MTPFQQFRVWARRAPAGERMSASVVALVLIGLLAWVLVPGGGSSSNAAPTANSTTNTSGPRPGSTAIPTPVPPPTKCVGPSGTVPGVSATQIKVAIVLSNIQGAASNALFGVLSVTDQKADFGKIIAALNKAGGVDCRQLVPQYFAANPADQSNLQQNCLNIAQSGSFAVIDAGAYAQFPIVDCFPQHHLPYFGGYLLPQSQLTKFYPYLFELNALDVVYHDTISGLASQGWFTAAKGFKKVGIIYKDCYPELLAKEKQWLGQAHVLPSQIVTYDVGCPAAFANSVDIQNAILKFKRAGVTSVTTVNMVSDFPTFTKLAQLQKYHPKYLLPDDSLITTSYGLQRPDYNNIAGALAVAPSRDGEERTPNAKPTAATQKCSSIIGTNVYQQPAAAGNACDQVWMFAAAVAHAPTLTQSALAAGLKAAGSVDFSYPEGPNDFSVGTNLTYGGQYWRTTQFMTSCKCWQVIDPTFRRSWP